MSTSTGRLQRQETIRQISRPASSSQHSGPFHRGTLKAFDYVMKEGNFLPLNEKSFDLKEFLKLSKEEEELSSGTDRKRIRRSPGGRCDGEQQGLHAAPRQASPRLRSLAARARATLEVCQGPSSKRYLSCLRPVTSTHGTTRLLLG